MKIKTIGIERIHVYEGNSQQMQLINIFSFFYNRGNNILNNKHLR